MRLPTCPKADVNKRVRRPIAIKKCQDDQEFDITQSEIVGALFTSAATIRLIQASATVNIRDSVPPDSALRYDPAHTSSSKKKRSRGSSARANGTQSPANKRQKLSNINPDKPLPSCEQDQDGSQYGNNASIIPNSQENMGRSGSIRGEIPATVSPPPHPLLLHPVHSEKWPTDQIGYKPVTASRDGAPPTVAQSDPSRTKASAVAPAKSKSASYHIERATERGKPVSTAATSPLSADQCPPPQDRPILPNMSRISGTVDAAKANGRPSPKQGTIYDIDDVESSTATSSAIIDKTRASLKERKSPMNKVSPQGQVNKSRTPSGGQLSTAELPMTPSSRNKGHQGRKMQSEATENSGNNATPAAEQRGREASEAKKREAEHTKAAELALQKRAEQERLAAIKLAAVSATAARLEKERVENLKRKIEAEEKHVAEQKRIEQARIKKAKEQTEKLEKEKKKKQEEERVQKEKAKAVAEAEVKRLREEERISKQKEQAENETMKRKLSSASIESSISGGRPGPSPAPRPPSSTSLTPIVRKSALKSSQTFGSSPVPRHSPSPSIASSQAPANENQRRVSFNLGDTPIRQERGSSKLPPTEASFEKHSHSPIRPPATIFTKNRTVTPVVSAKKNTTSITPPPSITPKVTVKGPSPPPERDVKNGAVSRSSTAKGTWP